MVLTVELPDNLSECADPAREALETLAIEAYRTNALTHDGAAKLLKLGRLAFDDLLSRRGVTVNSYGVDDFLEDVQTGDALRASGRLSG